LGLLGTVLLATAAGAFAGMVAASRLINRYGSASVTRFSTLLLCGCFLLPALAPNAPALAAALFVYGAASGLMDVAMNTEAVVVETSFARPVMVTFHAMYSFGAMVGALVGSAAAARGLAPSVHLASVGAAMAALSVPVCRGMLAAAGPEVLQTGFNRELLRPLLALGFLAFCILLGEGAMADWSAIYLRQFAGPGVAPLGLAVFSLAMGFGRLCGDWLRRNVGAVATVRYGGLTATAGLTAALIIGGVPATLAGFGCMGLGFAAIYPILCSVGGSRAGDKPQAGIAVVSGTGYLGFLVGPPLIGWFAQAASLRVALLLVAALSAVCAVGAGIAREAVPARRA
jgi:MFS family permease